MSRAVVIDRRTLILDHAERHFAEHGYKGAVLAEIARAAGLGNAGLIHHFPGKAALYRAVLERLAGDLDHRLASAMAGRRDASGRLAAFVDMQVRWAAERPQAFTLIQRELLDNRDRVAAAHALPLTAFVATGMAIIAEAQADGEIVPGPPADILCMIVGSLTYSVMVQPTFRKILKGESGPDGAEWIENVGRLVLASLAAAR